jgi:hypothetical protein
MGKIKSRQIFELISQVLPDKILLDLIITNNLEGWAIHN